MKTAFVFSSLLALLFSSAPSNAAEQWPIKVLKIDELKKAELAQDQDKPNTSQPEAFDPAHFKSLKDIPQDANFQHAKKLTQTGALAITEYYFDTDDEPSFLLDIKKSSKRHGLYTHIDQYMFSPNYETLLLDNTVKQANGKWRSLRRVIDVNSKASTQLPDVDCTRFQGFAANSGFVTYGSGTKKADDSFGPPREVCVWGKDAKLKSALSVPLQNTLANSEASANAVGLLPSDETVLFQLAYDNKRCILRLQSLSQEENHRSVELPQGHFIGDDPAMLASGDIGEPCEDKVAVELDLSKLTLSSGTLRYRISKSGRGDLKPDWTSWAEYH